MRKAQEYLQLLKRIKQLKGRNIPQIEYTLNLIKEKEQERDLLYSLLSAEDLQTINDKVLSELVLNESLPEHKRDRKILLRRIHLLREKGSKMWHANPNDPELENLKAQMQEYLQEEKYSFAINCRPKH